MSDSGEQGGCMKGQEQSFHCTIYILNHVNCIIQKMNKVLKVLPDERQNIFLKDWFVRA